jgi:hypothetical protein
MSEAVPNRLTVAFEMTADDYRRAFAVANRHQSVPYGYLAYLAALFAAIPVALAFRFVGKGLSGDAAAADLIGRYSLFAYMLGAIAMVVAGLLLNRRAVARHLDKMLNAYAPKTVIFDAAGVTLTGQLSQASWLWAAISGVSDERGLLLIWIGSSPVVVIPRGSLGDDGAREAAYAFIRARLSEKASGRGPSNGNIP